MPVTTSKKRPLPVPAVVVTDAQDEDGEAVLVELEPQPHEIATDPALRCRYPSKHCLRRRTLKKTGALHSMCAFHRAKANRNQRRLEKRKRVRLAAAKPVATTPAAGRPVDARQSPRGVAAELNELEPFRSPAALRPEDLEELCALVDVAVGQSCGPSPSQWPTVHCEVSYWPAGYSVAGYNALSVGGQFATSAVDTNQVQTRPQVAVQHRP